jgi:predicted RNA-binding Zn ribbon-like protein
VLVGRGGTQQLTRISGHWRLWFAADRGATALEVIAQSAARTITDRLTRVRRCAGDQCSLFFTDDSPTGSRRWCDPSVCGRDARVERRRGALR